MLINIAIFIDNFQTFMAFIIGKNNPYQKIFNSIVELFDTLELLQKLHPVKYGVTPRSSRGSARGLMKSSNGSAGSSPRTDVSPRIPVISRKGSIGSRQNSSPYASSDREDNVMEQGTGKNVSSGFLSRLTNLLSKH
jgi:hypothetical protein